MAARRPTSPRPDPAGQPPARGPARSSSRASTRPKERSGRERVRTPDVAGRRARGGAVAPPRGLSRRAAVLAVLLLVVATAMSPFVRALVEQQSRVRALEADVAEREVRVDELSEQLDRWQDPAFVAAQARQRFTYVMPGEVGYVVLDQSRAQQDAEDPSGAAARQAAAAEGSWFGNLWTSVEIAGEVGEPVPAAPAPGPEPVPAP